jgi:glycosyltransferase involved in cell wall biosynthesis
VSLKEVKLLVDKKDYRIAWLLPSLELGDYWQPIFRELTRLNQQTRIFTGAWKGFIRTCEDAFTVEIVGKTTFIQFQQSTNGYSQGYIKASPAIVLHLLRFQPQVIFTSGFSIWTLLSILTKPLGGWAIVVAYDGSSPMIDCLNAPRRLQMRRWMSHFVNAFITNTSQGKAYLTSGLDIEPQRVFVQPYQVADATALLDCSKDCVEVGGKSNRPIFLFVGRVQHRKGIQFLLEACALLKQQGYQFSLWIIGEGPQREELEAFCQSQGLEDFVRWLGYQHYSDLGTYFKQVDAFVFPTLEDIWGMVVLEAMVFGKPILCSKWAGASELVVHGENGYVFDPKNLDELATAMRHLCDHPVSVTEMGAKSKELITQHTPVKAAEFLNHVAEVAVQY